VLDRQVKLLNAQDPYLVFPVPANVKAATTQTSATGTGGN
jgi:hypothetical protein